MEELAVEAATLLGCRRRRRGGGYRRRAIHERLGRAWGCGQRGMELIAAALVLLADHELNASTFAARVRRPPALHSRRRALSGWRLCRGHCTAAWRDE